MDAIPTWIPNGSHSGFSGTTRSGTPPKTGQKLRASCDGCFAAKLRCTKEKPTCPRCKNLGLICHYSPSQRTGKPLNRKTRTSIQPPTLSYSQAYPSPQSSKSLKWTSPAECYDAQSIANPSTKPNHSTAKTSLPTPDDLSFGQPEPNFWDRQSSVTASTTLSDEDFLAQWPEQLPFPTEEDLLYDENSDNLMDVTIVSTRSTGENEPMPVLSLRANEQEGCKCLHSIMQTLQTMQTQPRDTNRQTLDTILNNSRSLIGRGEAMLDCACSEDGALVMLLSGLIVKHISSFGAAGTASTPPPPSTSSSSRYIQTTHSETIPSATSRVMIGTYVMNGEDEDRLRIEIVLMELQKLNTLLLKYRRKFSSMPVAGEMQTYETIFNFLYAKLRDAQSRLEEQKQKMRGAS